jgi:hypothetical protein
VQWLVLKIISLAACRSRTSLCSAALVHPVHRAAEASKFSLLVHKCYRPALRACGDLLSCIDKKVGKEALPRLPNARGLLAVLRGAVPFGLPASCHRLTSEPCGFIKYFLNSLRSFWSRQVSCIAPAGATCVQPKAPHGNRMGFPFSENSYELKPLLYLAFPMHNKS